MTPSSDRGNARRFTAERRVRLSDVSPKGRLRLDAAARYLQDIANDDAVDAIGEDAAAWVVRRTVFTVERFPAMREQLTLATWATGIGSRWAERTTSIEGERGGSIRGVALWVHVDLESGRPKVLPPSFEGVYGESIGGRKVSARLEHGTPPPTADHRPWTPRFADFDVLGHVNNAVYWAVVEEHLDVAAPVTVEVEYRGGVDRGQTVDVLVEGSSLWITADGVIAASARATTNGV